MRFRAVSGDGLPAVPTNWANMYLAGVGDRACELPSAHADVRAVEIHPVVAQERPQREHLGRKKSPKGQCAISVLEGSER